MSYYTTYKNDDGMHYSDQDLREQYEEMLRECHEVTMIAGMEYDTACALREVDPTAYRCGLIDFIESLELEEVGHETVHEFLAAFES